MKKRVANPIKGDYNMETDSDLYVLILQYMGMRNDTEAERFL